VFVVQLEESLESHFMLMIPTDEYCGVGLEKGNDEMQIARIDRGCAA
jgi:hypothetical protein